MAKNNVVDPSARDKYLLQVTAGPTYDPSTHTEVNVNGANSTCVENDLVTSWLKVRIKDYHGLPHGSPASSPYFEHALHKSDRYSVAFSFVPKEDFAGNDIIMGFDYDHSIKHQLPPGFKYAMKIATTMLDPGLYSDPYSDNPYLYGPALSGFFTLNIGEWVDDVSAHDQLASLERGNNGVVEEGAVGSGQSIRDELGLPIKWKKRRKHFLTAANLEKFVFEKGRMYHADFFNPYLDFANFSLRLPGFSISVARYIDEKTHHLRFVLKNRKTNGTLFVVFFRLLFGEELEKMLENKKGVDSKEKEGENGVEHTPKVPATDADPKTESIESKERTAEARQGTSPQPPTLQRKESSGDERDATTAQTAVTSLASTIYSAFAAMSFRDETSSSSEDDTKSKPSSAPASTRTLNAQVDNMDNKTVEKYLQSRSSNV